MELTTAQVAARLGVNEQRVLALTKQGRIEPTRRVRGAYLFDEAAIEAFAALPRVRTGRPKRAPTETAAPRTQNSSGIISEAINDPPVTTSDVLRAPVDRLRSPRSG